MKTATLRHAFTIAAIIGFACIIALAIPAHPVAAQSSDQDPGQLEEQPDCGARPDGDRPGRRPPRKGGPLMRVIDTDRDGQLSSEEIENAVKALKTLDQNGDGMLGRDELRPPRRPRRGQQD